MTQRDTAAAPYQLKIVGSEIRVEKPEELGKSFFREEYKNILRAVGKVIESNEREHRQKNEACRDKRYSPDIRIHNIIPIIGPRGSGKSSILHTVASILYDSGRACKERDPFLEACDEEKHLLSGKKFFVTESINGTLLEPHEDIFLTILAQMKKMLSEDEDGGEKRHGGNSYLLRELRKAMEELYGNARQEEKSTSRYRRDEMSDLTALNQLSDSLRLRQNFRKLLFQFLDFCTSDHKYNDSEYGLTHGERPILENCYLVIPIDDLDLNIENGYDMLEKLHRYLMLPNVIILLAIDQGQFKRLCEHHFYRMIPTYDSRMNAAAQVIDEMASQYLEKVMPTNLRTYVPRLVTRRDVNVTINDNRELPSCLPKHLVFKLLYEKLGMRMDTDGGKRHFLERDPLRDYVNLVILLQNLSSPFHRKAEKVEFDEDVFQNNYRILYQEITNGMATSLLSNAVVLQQYQVNNATTVSTYTYQQISTKTRFDRIIDVVNPIPRAFRLFFSIVANEGRPAPAGSTIRKLADSLDRYDFSYGEILHIIYHYGRLNIDNKPLIHCLLAYYSTVMNQNYLLLRQQQLLGKEGSAELIRQYRKEFLELMNGSVSGSWANAMVPMVRWSNYQFYGAGLRRVLDMRNAFSFEHKTLKGYFGKVLFIDDEEKIKIFFRAVLIIAMLFDRPNYKLDEMFSFETYEKTEWDALAEALMQASSDSVNNSPSFRPVSGKGTFGFLNFVSSAFQYHEYIEHLWSYVEDYVKDNNAIFNFDDRKKAEASIKAVKKEIEAEFDTWDRDYSSFAMPLYDLDVCYNLVKRLRQDRYGKPDYIDTDPDSRYYRHLFDSYLVIYRALAMRLDSNDQVYLKKCGVDLSVDGSRYRYADAFCNCPFIRWLGICSDGTMLTEAQQNKRTSRAGSIKDRNRRIVEHTIDLTQKLLERVFENLLIKGVSDCHVDSNEYDPTPSYDD